jgi:hypothetical protein
MKPAPDPHYRHRYRDHQLCRVAVSCVQTEPARCRVAPRRTGRGRLVREHQTLVAKFGSSFANSLRRRRPRLGDKCHLDEVFIRIQGELHYLWRAVDQDGVVLDI